MGYLPGKTVVWRTPVDIDKYSWLVKEMFWHEITLSPTPTLTGLIISGFFHFARATIYQ
jgi:hypothetical protein